MTILELMEKRAKAWDAAKNFLDTHITENGLSAEDQVTHEKMLKDVENLTAAIKRLEDQQKFEDSLKNPTSDPVFNDSANGGNNNQTGRESREYFNAFVNYARTGAIENILQTTPNADGGFLIPTEYEKILIQKMEENNIFRQIAKVIQTTSERKIPVEVNGTTANWTKENQEAAESTPKFKQLSLDAYKLTVFTKASIELLQDSFINIDSYLIEDFGKAIGIKEEEAFCTGDGNEKPTGLFGTDGGGEIYDVTGTAITGDIIIDLIYALKMPYRRNARFVTNDNTVAAIRKLKDNQQQYLWQPSMQQGQPDRIFGFPVLTSPAVPKVAAGSFPIAFGDFSYYRIGDRMKRTIQRLNELYARNGQVGFMATSRVDAIMTLPEAVKVMKMGGGE